MRSGPRCPGWLVVVPRRHVIALDELTAEEAAGLGPLLRALTAAMRAVLGCGRSYVALFAESEGSSMSTSVLSYPGAPIWTQDCSVRERSRTCARGSSASHVPAQEMDQLTAGLGQALRLDP